jgi:hypothetical protein
MPSRQTSNGATGLYFISSITKNSIISLILNNLSWIFNPQNLITVLLHILSSQKTMDVVVYAVFEMRQNFSSFHSLRERHNEGITILYQIFSVVVLENQRQPLQIFKNTKEQKIISQFMEYQSRYHHRNDRKICDNKLWRYPLPNKEKASPGNSPICLRKVQVWVWALLGK